MKKILKKKKVEKHSEKILKNRKKKSKNFLLKIGKIQKNNVQNRKKSENE